MDEDKIMGIIIIILGVAMFFGDGSETMRENYLIIVYLILLTLTILNL